MVAVLLVSSWALFLKHPSSTQEGLFVWHPSSTKTLQTTLTLLSRAIYAILQCFNTVLSVAGIMEWVKILSSFHFGSYATTWMSSKAIPVDGWTMPLFKTFLIGNGLQRTKNSSSKKTSLLVYSYASFFNYEWRHGLVLFLNHQTYSCFLNFSLSSDTKTLQTLSIFKHICYRLWGHTTKAFQKG